jgi:hypothetical protein
LLDRKREHEASRADHLEIFADMLDILAVAPLQDVEPAAGARVDLCAHDLSTRRRKQPSAGGPRIEPGVEDALRRRAQSAPDVDIDALLGVHRNRPSALQSSMPFPCSLVK